MSRCTRTGLMESPVKRIYKREKVATIQLRAVARPAPFILKPFAGLYNPFPFGCSLLCNHPASNDAKELLKRARNDGPTAFLDDLDAFRESLEDLELNKFETVPEELFRRYTDTDSRPMTPTPTTASANTRPPRRCVTPDPTNRKQEKTLIILDLRRSHSQETLSWQGSNLQEPPVIRISRVPTLETVPIAKSIPSPRLIKPPSRSPTPTPKKSPKEETITPEATSEPEDDDFKRRGKKRRKKRDSSRAPPIESHDPETQMATLDPESHNPSTRPSLIPATSMEQPEVIVPVGNSKFQVDSFLDLEIIKQLRRELNEEIIDNEFNLKRKTALMEALKTVPKERLLCDELIQIQNELKLAKIDRDFWLSLPRVFSRSSARFELPMDSRTLETLTVLSYIRGHVFVSTSRKLLYNCIFNKFETDRLMMSKDVQPALDLMMGRSMTSEQAQKFQSLVQWETHDVIDFQTFSGLCALCERLLAPEFCSMLPDRTKDPCHEIETADFSTLARKLRGKTVSSNLVQVLNGIKTL